MARAKKPKQTVSIDGKEYDLDASSEQAKAQLQNIQFCEMRLRQLKNELAVADTARLAYSAAIKRESKS